MASTYSGPSAVTLLVSTADTVLAYSWRHNERPTSNNTSFVRPGDRYNVIRIHKSQVPWILDVKKEETLTIPEAEATLMPLDRSWLPLSENLITQKKKNLYRSARRCIWRYSVKAGVWINCQIINQVMEYQLFTSLWNSYHQRLSGIELIQIIVFFFSFFFQE